MFRFSVIHRSLSKAEGLGDSDDFGWSQSLIYSAPKQSYWRPSLLGAVQMSISANSLVSTNTVTAAASCAEVCSKS